MFVGFPGTPHFALTPSDLPFHEGNLLLYMLIPLCGNGFLCSLLTLLIALQLDLKLPIAWGGMDREHNGSSDFVPVLC